MTNSCENASDTELSPSQGPPRGAALPGRGPRHTAHCPQSHGEHHELHLGIGTLGLAPCTQYLGLRCGHLVEEAVWNGARARSQHSAAFGFYAEHWSPPPQPPGREIACTLLHVVGQLEADFFPLEWGNPEQAIPKPSHDSCTQPPPCQPRWGN